MWEGYYGNVDVAVVEVAGVTENGEMIPSASIGNNKTWLDVADKVITRSTRGPGGDVRHHDVYLRTALPPYPQADPDHFGRGPHRSAHAEVDPNKVVAVSRPTRATAQPAHPADEISQAIAAHVLDFFEYEVSKGRPQTVSCRCKSASNVANAVLQGLDAGPHKGLTCFSEVIQDGMLHLIKHGTVRYASATSWRCRRPASTNWSRNIDFYASTSCCGHRRSATIPRSSGASGSSR